MKKTLRNIIFAMVATFFLLPHLVYAAEQTVTLKDLQTINRTIGFLENKAPSPLVMAIIYDPDNTTSRRHARLMKTLLDKESGTTALLVRTSDMAALEDASVAFVTTGLEPHFDRIRQALEQHRILSFTLDRKCVEQDCCAIYVNSSNRVQIVINKSITDTLNARFKPVFLMLVTVI